MATFNERIQVVIDVVTDKATKGFKDFRTAVGEAEGFTGKLKAGVSSLGGVFGAATSGPVAMGAAVATAATFAVKAVSDYADLGVEIGNFATATGLATEDASRWIEVSGDLGVSAETLQGVFGKLNKSIDTKLFDDLGVSIARTSAGTVDANNTFLNVIKRLQQIKDPAEQAKTAAQLLGKGWQSIAPIIGQSADDIRNRLNDVADVKVFDQKKVDDSKKFRDAFAELKDAGEEFAVSLGETVIPEVTALAKAAVFVVKQLQRMNDALFPSSNAIKMADQQREVNDLFKQYGSFLFDTKAAQDAGVESLNDFRDATGFASDESRNLIEAIKSQAAELVSTNAELAAHASNSDNSARAAAMLATYEKDVAREAQNVARDIEAAKNRLKDFQDQIKGRSDLVTLVDDLETTKKKLQELNKAYDPKKDDAAQFWRNTAMATDDAIQKVSDFVSGIKGLPPDKAVELIASYDPMEPQKFLTNLQRAVAGAQVFVGVTPVLSGNVKNLMEGGIPAGNGASVHNVNINVRVEPGANPAEFGRHAVDAINAYYRAGGNRIK